ncbi:hypothetical protein OYT88_14180 [Sporolactobacillus sp. CQH2019]|uniref:hypothetical protein n=1 Tax=Sporolactobacillus sp. CQH2019 TaxID=3023512 RepID=UPI002367DE6A|nr:hypothetical protein [Sporolactobacillus sp. CQH2019]MDD9149698.1 hypothetical protein [Sporolactobacillus sp. CQH2019]
MIALLLMAAARFYTTKAYNLPQSIPAMNRADLSKRFGAESITGKNKCGLFTLLSAEWHRSHNTSYPEWSDIGRLLENGRQSRHALGKNMETSESSAQAIHNEFVSITKAFSMSRSSSQKYLQTIKG